MIALISCLLAPSRGGPDNSCEPLTTATLIKVGHNSTSMPSRSHFPLLVITYVRARSLAARRS